MAKLSALLSALRKGRFHLGVLAWAYGLILIFGYMISDYTVTQAEDNSRESFLSQTLLAATSIEVADLKELEGSASDREDSTSIRRVRFYERQRKNHLILHLLEISGTEI